MRSKQVLNIFLKDTSFTRIDHDLFFSGRLILTFEIVFMTVAENSKNVKASAMVGHNEKQTYKST
jgi:hypothetical protein